MVTLALTHPNCLAITTWPLGLWRYVLQKPCRWSLFYISRTLTLYLFFFFPPSPYPLPHPHSHPTVAQHHCKPPKTDSLSLLPPRSQRLNQSTLPLPSSHLHPPTTTENLQKRSINNVFSPDHLHFRLRIWCMPAPTSSFVPYFQYHTNTPIVPVGARGYHCVLGSRRRRPPLWR